MNIGIKRFLFIFNLLQDRKHAHAKWTSKNSQKFNMGKEKVERRVIKEYRKTLVHKARPMPQYKFFIPKPSSRPLTIPRSPNFPKPKNSSKNETTTSEYSLPELSSHDITPTTDGGSFLGCSSDTKWDKETHVISESAEQDRLKEETMGVDNADKVN